MLAPGVLALRVSRPSLVGLSKCTACRSYRPVCCRAVGQQTKQPRLTHNETTSDAQQQAEAYRVATERLQAVITDASLSNKDLVPMDFLDACTLEERLTLFTNIGTLVTLSSILLCWLFGEGDPLGGMMLNYRTLDAALQGAAYAVPLLMCSLSSRTPLFRESFPVLEEMHEKQQDTVEHIIGGMNLPQISIFLTFLVIPSMMLLLPTTTSALHWAGHFGHQALLQTWEGGLHFKPVNLGPLSHVLPPVLSGYWAGLLAASCCKVRPKVVESIKDAFRSADSYFRLNVHQQRTNISHLSARHSGSAPKALGTPAVFASTTYQEGVCEGDVSEAEPPVTCRSQMAADAFKTLAMLWLISRHRVARLAFILTALDVAYLSMIWQATGNLATPAAAAFLHASAELILGEQQKQQNKKRAWTKHNTSQQGP